MSKEKAGAKDKNFKKNGVSKGVAIFLAVLFVLFAVLGIIGFNVWRVLFNPRLVKEALTQEVTSTDIVPSALELFSEWRAKQRVQNNESLSGVNEPDIVLLLSFMKAEDWKQVKELLVTDELVTHIVSTSVDGVYLWIDSDDVWPDIRWDMTKFKERLVGQNGEDAIMIAYNKLPPATDEQIADFEHRLSQVPEGVEVLYNLAQFPEPWTQDQVGDYIDALSDANENIPADFEFSKEFGQTSSQQASLQTKALLRTIRFIAIALWVLALILLALILGLKVRSWKDLGKFVGIPLIIVGVIAVAIALICQPIVINMISNNLLAGASDFAKTELTGSLRTLSALFFKPLLWQGVVIGGLGIVFVILMAVIKKKTKPGASMQAEAGVSQQ